MNYEYANFNIEISSYTADENEAEQFKVRLLPSSGVQPLEGQSLSEAETVELTTDTRDMVRWIEERKLKTLDELIELGERLAALIFPDRVRQDLTSTLNILKDRQKTARTSGEKVWVLRIKLIIDSYALADLPWEYVYLLPPNTPKKQKDITGFLALDRDVSIVRYPVVSGASGEFAPITSGPVKMLAVFADAVSPAYAALDMAQEKRILDEALTGTPIQKTDCEMATLANVGQMLNAQRPHIFHFSGHGIFEGESSGEVYGSKVGRGSLVLVDENKAPMKLAADGVALLLGKRQIRLAMLGACEVAKRGVVNAWTGESQR